ncbi:MAG TPA: zinc ribbon domain-containing protein [Candidatus Binatia bacterium]|nr:zinc ribbon domain-containing protein [Candidatus Binatia bacterium]
MAFCNSCGATLGPDAKFCSRCGATTGASGVSPSTAIPPAAPAARGGGSAVKVVLIVVGVIVLLGGIGIASLAFIAVRVARNSHVSQQGEHVKLETPFGNVETSKDPDKAVKDLGVDLYPGAEVEKNGASSATFGGNRAAAAAFQSSDSADKVCSFYRSKFPSAKVVSSSPGRCTIVSNDSNNVVTVNVQSNSGGCKFQISTVIKKDANP